MGVLVRSQVVCVAFMCFYHLLLTCSSLDNDLISPAKHITTHLNAHAICTNIHTCTSGSLVALEISIKTKKTEKSECGMLLDMLSVISVLIYLFGCTLKCHIYIFSVATAAMLMMVVIPVPNPSRAERSKRNTGLLQVVAKQLQ